jgi:hypothetical protein
MVRASETALLIFLMQVSTGFRSARLLPAPGGHPAEQETRRGKAGLDISVETSAALGLRGHKA